MCSSVVNLDAVVSSVYVRMVSELVSLAMVLLSNLIDCYWAWPF